MDRITLRPYQLEICDFFSKSESNSILCVQPTGTGKTVEFMHYAITNFHRTLVLVNSEELIDQAIATAKLIDPHVSIGKFIGVERDLDSQIIVASVQTLKNINNLTMIDRDFSLIIYDEAHHIVSTTSKRILYAFGLCDLDTAGHENVVLIDPNFMPERKLLGFTATPERTDEISLGKIFKNRVDAPPLEWFIEQGYLSDLKFISIETGIDMSDVRAYAGDFSERQMAEKLIESGYINELSRVIGEYFAECKSILLYVPDVQTARLASKLINRAGISSDYVVGSERDRRKDVIGRFKRGDIRVLVNCLVLKEGFDAPNTDAIIVCRPTKSKLLLKQIIGRGTRPFEGKNVCIIGDLVVKRRQDDIIYASGVFDEIELSPIEQDNMTIREKIKIQRQKSVRMTELVRAIDDIRLLAELEEEEERKKRRQKREEVYQIEKMPDSVSLLLDTRLMRMVGLDAKAFTQTFLSEQHMLNRGSPINSLLDREIPYDYQMKYLRENTSYSDEDLSMLTPMEAQSLINIMKRQTKEIIPSRRRILENVYKLSADKVPSRDIDARRLIKHLQDRRLKHGKA